MEKFIDKLTENTGLFYGQRNFDSIEQAQRYSKNRPIPSTELIETIVDFVKQGYKGDLTEAIDVGCGSGQATYLLSSYFDHVTGVDISRSQLEIARQHGGPRNVDFKVGRAEELPLPDGSAQLISAFVAMHYFDLGRFVPEVDRVLARGGVLSFSLYENPVIEYTSKEGRTLTVGPQPYNQVITGLANKGLGDQLEETVDKEWPASMYYGQLQKKFPYEEIKTFSCEIRQPSNLQSIVEYVHSLGLYQNCALREGEDAARKELQLFQSRVESGMKKSGIPLDANFQYKFDYFTMMSRKP